MSLTDGLLHITDFRAPFLQTFVPAAASAYAIQTAFGVHGVLKADEHFYDFSGGITFLAATSLSFLLPILRAGHAIAADTLAQDRDWRQTLVTGAVIAYSTRRKRSRQDMETGSLPLPFFCVQHGGGRRPSMTDVRTRR